MKNGQVMAMVKRARQSGAGLFWAIRWPLRLRLRDMNFKFVLPIIYINWLKPSLESIRSKSVNPQKDSKNSPKVKVSRLRLRLRFKVKVTP